MLTSSKYGMRQLVMKNLLGDYSHSEKAKYFEWMIIIIMLYIIEFKQRILQSPYALKDEELRHAVDDKCQVSLLIKEWQLIISCKPLKTFQLSLINVLDVSLLISIDLVEQTQVNNSLRSRRFGVIVTPLESLSNNDGDENVTWKLNSRCHELHFSYFLLFYFIQFGKFWEFLWSWILKNCI